MDIYLPNSEVFVINFLLIHSLVPLQWLWNSRQLSESGAEYSTVNVHRSSISKFHAGFAGKPVGEHPLVSQAVKAVFRLKPPLPKYQSTFDIVPVLAYMRSLNTHTISLQLLAYKALFLTVYSNICRVSSMARLGPSLTEHRDSVVLHLVDLEKQARHGRVRGFFQIPKFDEDPQLCPVVTLVAYFNKVSIYIKRFVSESVSESVCPLLFVPGGQTICLSPGGQTFFTHRWGGGTNNFDIWRGGQTFFTQRGGTNIFATQGGTNIFATQGGGTNIFTLRGGGQTFYVKDVGGDDDVDGEEEDVSEANILVSEASKLSAGARIFRGP